MEPNINIMERQGSCLLLRSASQNSLDESSQKHISQIHPHTKERPPYRNHLHTQKAFDVMNVMRKQTLLCDVVLVAGDAEISAHKMVLAACSPYFYAMFSSFEESRQDRIVLQEVDQQALMLLIEYVYTSEVSVTEDNVQVLLPAANLLQLTDVRDACCDFLQAQLHPTNCLGIRAFADLHGCLELLSHAEYYIELHFSEVVECEEFLTLSHLQVSKLISSDRLTVPTEEKVFECVVAWVQNDLESRKQHLSSLMEYVRLPLMSQEYLVQRVEQEPLLKTDLQCKDYIIEALKYHLLKGDNKTSFRTPRTKPRQPVGLPKVLLVVGGQAPKAIRSVESYDFKEERWYQVAEMPTRRCRAGLAVLGSKVYAVGGFNGSLRVKTVDYYDPAMDVWTACDSMEARRSTLGVAVLNNCIYAVGGFDGSTGLNSAEMFDPQTGKWRIIASMSTRRSSVGVGVLYGQLYAVGGYDGASRQCLSSVECYTPDTDTWISVPDMGCRRSGAGVGDKYIDENSNAEGAVGYETQQLASIFQENIYETIFNDHNDPNASTNLTSNRNENIYETIEDLQTAREALFAELPYDSNIEQPSCSSTYGRIGNAYGRIDIIGHGIGRIERHLSSSCCSINNNHNAIENLYGTKDHTGRISKVSVQWLLANKWLPLWIANTETGRDYRIIDFLLAQGLEKDEDDDSESNGEGRGNNGGNNVKEQ